MDSLPSKIEAILYLKGQPISISEIAEIAKCDRGQVKDALIELMSEYAHRQTALEIVETEKGYTLQLKPAFAELTESLIQPELGVGTLRTLAAIALKGGIAQSELVDIRGSGVYQHVPELVALGFVRKRRQKESRSYWLQVTDKFHQYFQLDQLPQQLSLDIFALPNGNETNGNENNQSEEE
ncbi:MAG: SMC-Scp complex subunit ScpB [Trichodesmium sp.]